MSKRLIGSSDDLASGFSTFMIEMTETTNILHNVIERGLAPVDEIGRSNMYY